MGGAVGGHRLCLSAPGLAKGLPAQVFGHTSSLWSRTSSERHARRVFTEKLLAGQQTLRRVRLSVSGTMLAIGIPCAVTSWVAFFFTPMRTTDSLQADLLTTLCGLLVPLAMTCLTLAATPDSMFCTKAVMVANILVFTMTGLFNISFVEQTRSGGVCAGDHSALRCDLAMLFACYWLVMDVLFVGLLLLMLLVLRCGAAEMQLYMWGAITLLCVMEVCGSLACIVLSAFTIDAPTLNGNLGFFIGYLGSLIVARSPTLRKGLHDRLQNLFAAQGAKAAAAGIAGLVGDCSPRKALQEASLRFRCLSGAQLQLPMLADSNPDLSLPQLAQAAKLGQCDAFVSHSWHDDMDAKWEALQGWCEDFRRQHGREPLLWFDKVCIDQGNIEADLRCLPLFLHGCKQLVLLCGVTYLSRLWTVVELFTFVHMGGCESQVVLVPVLRGGREEEDMAVIRQNFQQFDARNCQCKVSQDKEKMLGIMRAAFGSMDGFNQAIHRILLKAGLSEEAAADKGGDGLPADAERCSSSAPSSEDSDDQGRDWLSSGSEPV